MGFLNQAMLWGMLAIAVPLAIHLIHRRKARRVPFPAIEFILRSRKAVAKRFRIKQLVLLALRCMLVGAIAFAAARPLFAGRDAAVGPSGGPAAVAIAIDSSLSMRARSGGGTAFQAAKDAALQLVNSLGPDVEAVIVPFGADAKALPPVPTADKTVLVAAIEGLQPGWSTTGVGRGLDTAAQAIAGSQKPRKVVYLFTDGAAPGWSEVGARDATQDIGWRVIDVTGRAPANTTVTGLEVREEGSGATARAEIQSFGPDPVAGASIEVLVNDRAAGRNFVDLAAGGTASTVFSLAPPPAGLNVAVARVAPDALPEDDARYAAFRGQARVRTLLVDGDPKTTLRDAESFYLERALAPSRASTNHVAPVVVDVEGLVRANLAQFDVVVLANAGNLSPATVLSLKRWVANGGGLLVAVGDKMDAEQANDSLGELLAMRLRGVRETTAAASEGGAIDAGTGNAGAPRALSLGPLPGRHPVTDSLDIASQDVFTAIRFHKTQTLEGAAGGATTILKFSDGSPALVERPVGRGKVALFASTLDRDWNDLPIATVFLPLTRRVIGHLAGELGDESAVPVEVGHPVQIEVGDKEKVRVEGPDGFAAKVVTAVDGAVEIVPTLPGVYRLSNEDGRPDERLSAKGFAANVPSSESDLRKVSEAELARIFAGVDFSTSGGLAEPAGTATSAVPDQPLWGLLLGLGLVALVLESAVSTL